MGATQRIVELEHELASQKQVVQQAVARLLGIEAELASMKAGVAVAGSLPELSRTDAILSVLRDSKGTLTPTEILTRLTAAGRPDELRSITATLNHLLTQGLVQRPQRAHYLAT